MNLPAPPIIRVMAAIEAGKRRLLHRPTAEQIIHAHITLAQERGIDFDPRTEEAESRSLARRAT